MAKKSIRGEPYKYEPYQANDTSSQRFNKTRNRYSPDHTYIIAWFTESPELDTKVKRILASLGVSAMLQSDSTMRLRYKLISTKRREGVENAVRQQLLPGIESGRRGRGNADSAFHRLDFSIQEIEQ